MDEVDELKRQKDLLERSVANKDTEILELHGQLETSNAASRNADNRLKLLESQVATTSSILLSASPSLYNQLTAHNGSLYVWVTPKINTKVYLAFPI